MKQWRDPAIILVLAIQTLTIFFYGGQMSERVNQTQEAVRTLQQRLDRYIERQVKP